MRGVNILDDVTGVEIHWFFFSGMLSSVFNVAKASDDPHGDQ